MIAFENALDAVRWCLDVQCKVSLSTALCAFKIPLDVSCWMRTGLTSCTNTLTQPLRCTRQSMMLVRARVCVCVCVCACVG
jgi:hypothetical protein